MVRHEVFIFMTHVMCAYLYCRVFYSCRGSVWVLRQEVVNREAADNEEFLRVVYLILYDLG